MKKFILPSLLLILMVVFCVWATWRADQLCTESADLLERAGSRCEQGDFDGAEALVYEAKDCWDNHEGFFGIALRHTESDDVDILFPPLLESCRQKNAEEFSRRNLELIATFHHLSRAEIPYYFNIL